MNPKRILITGSGGLIGSTLAGILGERAAALPRSALDIADKEAFRAICLDNDIGVVVNAAGANSGPWDRLHEANAQWPAGLAEVCYALGIKMIFLSSSRVFAGDNRPGGRTEDDSPCPVDDYGRSKLAGEQLVSARAGGACYVIRLPMILGIHPYPERRTLFRLVEKGRRQGRVSIARDVIHSPLHVNDAATQLAAFIEEPPLPGVYHLSCSDTASLYELVSHAVGHCGLNIEVLPVDNSCFNSDQGPQNLALASVQLPPREDWRHAVGQFVNNYLRSQGRHV